MYVLQRPLAHPFLILLICAGAGSCGGSEPRLNNPTGPSVIGGIAEVSVGITTLGAGASVLVGAGDIARCDTGGAEATAKLLDGRSGTVFVAGDNAYMTGSAQDYRDCYHPTWGRHRARTRPVPGNHEYETPNGAGYFNYFGASAGESGLGYYGYTLGSWLVLALNSEIPLGDGSAQLAWVSAQLATSQHRCTAVYWHRPLFSSGPNGANADMLDLWHVLYREDVDLVMNGHDHLYERFAPQTPAGRLDPVRGIRQFTVGTGGAPTYPLARSAPNSEVAQSVWGVTAFTLQNGSYSWEFVPVEGEAFRDAGTAGCH